MAATILFLAGPGGLFYNEQTLYPDGGEFSAIFNDLQCNADVQQVPRLRSQPQSRF